MYPYSPDDLELDLRWWAAANYLTVGQIYLRENALLREPLTLDHVKPRLLGHWGTSPGLSMLYALLNRVIRETDSDWLYVTGPGHGGPALVAAGWLEGTYSEVYPHVGDDEAGVRALFRQFSSPGGVPSHVSVQTPGQHPRGRRARLRAGARGRGGLRQPGPHGRLRRRRRRGRDRAAVGLVAAAGLPQPAPRRRRAPGPAPQRLQDRRPTVLGRTSDEDVAAYLRSQGWDPVVVSGDDPREVFPALYAALSDAHDRSGRSAGASRDVEVRLAGDHPAHAEGLDRPRRRRRHPGAGHLPRPPGAALGPGREPRAPADAGGVAAVVLAGDAVRRVRPAGAGAPRPRARRRPAACRRRRTRTAAGCARTCRRSTWRSTRSPSRRRAVAGRQHGVVGRADARPVRRHGTPTPRSGCSRPTRRRATGCRRCSR